MEFESKTFLVYRHSSGEVVFVKRSAITSFHPKFVSKNLYRIYVTAADKEFPIHEVESIAVAEEWIAGQIKLIEGAK